MVGREFWKMSGSGNDFVFFNAMHVAAGDLATPARIGQLCERRTGIGADGVVFLERHDVHAFSMRYFNRDGSLAEMCGNAALCSTRLARELGIVEQGEFTFQTVSGPVTGRFQDGKPRIDGSCPLAATFETPRLPGEQRIGFARVGVPHLVVLVPDVELVDVYHRGSELRHLASLRDGANADFVSKSADGRWSIRTMNAASRKRRWPAGTGSRRLSGAADGLGARGAVASSSRPGQAAT
ncbi:MAG: diaminopimelate epimerase [Gemmatimonadetes bacterium]|nr:diaminopimelate epimerase [Gemmatimonadota bacterium]